MESAKNFFAKQKLTALACAISLVAVYEYFRIPVPDWIENRHKFKLNHIMNEIYKFIVIKIIEWSFPRSVFEN
jgi:hypothetical protein